MKFFFMRLWRASLVLVLSMLVATCAAAKESRSGAAKYQFKKLNPCPSTGKRFGSCPGYVIDHIKALDCGGDDSPSNMQWQTKEEAKAKDRTERRFCL